MFRRVIISLALVLALVGTASLQAQEVKTKDFSGWMQSYENLVYIEDRNAWLFTNEGRRGTYKAIMMGDVSVYGSNVEENGDIAQQASDYLREGICIEAVGDDVRRLAGDMVETMRAARGIGLAAQQIGKTCALFVVEVPPESRLGGYEGIGRDSEQFRDFAHRGAEHPPVAPHELP